MLPAGKVTEQQKHFEVAAMERSLYSKLNNSEPGVAATPRAGVLNGVGITRSSGGTPDHSTQSVSEATTGVNAK
jgi:hypothetical protein